MITIGQQQRLGRKTFMFFLSRRTTIASVLFIIALFIFALHTPLATGIAGVMSLGGSVTVQKVSSISASIAYISLAFFLLAIVAFLFGLLASWLQYRNYVFTFGEFGITMRRGILTQKEVSIAYRQIQDIDIIRSLPYRMFGVSKLIMITAGHESPDEHDQTDGVFDPIDKEMAEEIRTFLERRIGVQVIETEKQAVEREQIEKA